MDADNNKTNKESLSVKNIRLNSKIHEAHGRPEREDGRSWVRVQPLIMLVFREKKPIWDQIRAEECDGLRYREGTLIIKYR